MTTEQQTQHAIHGQAIKALRLACNPPMRQAELAQRLGLSQGTICYIEKGATRCPVAVARKISLLVAERSELTAWQVAVWIVMGEPQ